MLLKYRLPSFDRLWAAQQLSTMLMITTELADTNRLLTKRLIGVYD